MQGARSTGLRRHRFWLAAFVAAILGMAATPAPAEAAGTLDRIRQSGKIRLGYRADARPYAYRDEAGNAAGYSVALCELIASRVKSQLGLAALQAEWVPVPLEGRYGVLQEGSIDLLCGAETATLAKRKVVDFSIPIVPGGVGAILRSDSSLRLRHILTKGEAAFRPLWRASPAQVIQQQTFSVIPGTTAEGWIDSRSAKLHLSIKVVPVSSYDEGIRKVLDRSANVFFGDRAILVELAKRSPSSRDLIVLDRHFTTEPVALVLPRGDDDFRLLVDGTLSRLFRSGDIQKTYSIWFGRFDESAAMFFETYGLPD
jgi:ABC-type amino acid transport substrate-binding protein